MTHRFSPISAARTAARAGLCMLLLASCAGQFPPPGEIPHLGALPSFEETAGTRDALELRKAAIADYSRGDYVRALRHAYRAVRTIPTDIRLRLLLGIIYDSGFDRPDLALPEYRQVLDLNQDAKLTPQLRGRVHFLQRRLYESGDRDAAIEGDKGPLTRNWLAIYPLEAIGPRPPEQGTELALLDLLLPAVGSHSQEFHVDPFRLHILARVYGEVHPDGGAEAFARWSGAGRTLTGSVADLGDRQIRVVLKLLDESGRLVYESVPVSGSLCDPAALAEQLHAALGDGLEMPSLRTSGGNFGSSLAFSLYAEGLWSYFAGQVAESERRLQAAHSLDPESSTIARTYVWARTDRAGRADVSGLMSAYHRLLRLPDADRALHRRMQTAQGLLSPASGAETGEESLDPYKPPRPEAAP